MSGIDIQNTSVPLGDCRRGASRTAVRTLAGANSAGRDGADPVKGIVPMKTEADARTDHQFLRQEDPTVIRE
jgi:hypothetical protein